MSRLFEKADRGGVGMEVYCHNEAFWQTRPWRKSARAGVF
nr:MAG TPA: hypothetical protein [Caudoviricetes sp.]